MYLRLGYQMFDVLVGVFGIMCLFGMFGLMVIGMLMLVKYLETRNLL